VPLHAPPQALKDHPESGLAVSVTVVFAANEAEHVPRQLLIPAGLLLTEPFPDTVTVSVNVVVVENVTVTVRLLFIVTVHCLLSVETESQPLQLCTAEPASGVAVSVTVVFLAKLAEHVVPQLIPSGLLVTVPLPVLTTVSVTNTCETPALEPMKRASTAHPTITQNIFRYPASHKTSFGRALFTNYGTKLFPLSNHRSLISYYIHSLHARR
jgi:hypothetical protein